jgi:hypothetical protein
MADSNKDQDKKDFVQQAGTGAVFGAKFEKSAKQENAGFFGRGSFMTKSEELVFISIFKKKDKNGNEYLFISENKERKTAKEIALEKENAELKASLKKGKPLAGIKVINDKDEVIDEL